MKKCIHPLRAFFIFPLVFFAFLFTALISAAQSYTINFYEAPPAVSDPSMRGNDNSGGIETGVKFYVTQPGKVNGIRFYKGSGVTGTHIGHLWRISGGSPLASATFSESASGWQEVSFSSAVPVTAGDVYVASVFSVAGYYAATNFYWVDFGGGDYGTKPIKVLPYSGNPGGNGVYAYTNNPTGAFPTGDGSASNYWIDLRFTPTFALPVTLSEIKATAVNKDVTISWKTSSESNNKGFDLERSNNGSDWYVISYTAGTGESTTTKNYSYTDKGLSPGLYYYRLKQKDFDGKFTVSSVVTANISGKGQAHLFQNYPNPFKGTSAIKYDLPSKQKIKLSVTDMTGREIRVLANKEAEPGTHQVNFGAEGLKPSIYIVRLETESGTLTMKMIVQ